MTSSSLRIAAVCVLALAGCAESDRDPADDLIAESGTGGEQLYQVSATVLESPDHGPQLCFVVKDSLPPQCDGPDVLGWDWAAVSHESEGGTSWGQYGLIGAWDGERFTLVEVREPEQGESPFDDDVDFTSPCPEPADGWAVAEPAKATHDALEEALARAATADDYAGSWVDEDALPGRYPASLVLNLQFTGNLAEREQWIREVWGGALCVSEARYTDAELTAIQTRLEEEMPDLLTTSRSSLANAVEAQVYVATPELQAELDEKYGEGAVIVTGWLQPVD